MPQENTPDPSFGPSDGAALARDDEIRDLDLGIARIDLTGYSVPLFNGAIRVFEPPAPVRGENIAPPARVIELQFLDESGKIVAVGANRNMLANLLRALNKTLRVGDEYYKQKW